ncbi:MAG TPA: hypothetical protein VG733_13125 [Chthoniobacteraceae bacterium]|nr:hypothetical protein [Chthoniobacteraceae bacterium]
MSYSTDDQSDTIDTPDFTKPITLSLADTSEPTDSMTGNAGYSPGHPLLRGANTGMAALDGNQPFTFTPYQAGQEAPDAPDKSQADASTGNGQPAAASAPVKENRTSNLEWKNAVTSLSDRNEQRDDARLSDGSYEDDGGVAEGKVPAGYRVVTPDEVGLGQGDFADGKSGFHATLYQDTNTGRYVLAYRGTDPKVRADLINDAQQGFSFDSQQYDRGIRLAQKLDSYMQAKNLELTFTGHSLGGGLAAAAALATSRHANTFNAAAVSAKTLSRNGVTVTPGADQQLINSFYIPGEPLSAAQSASADGLGNRFRKYSLGLLDPVGEAQGRRIAILPVGSSPQEPPANHFWNRPGRALKQEGDDALWMHSIDRFNESMR